MESLFLLPLLVALVQASVIDMSSDFDSKILGPEVTFVKFYAPWCGHCRHIEPIFKEASEKNEGAAVFAEVNCDSDAGRKTCETLGVSGYPTLKLFRNGKFVEDYEGQRDVSSLVNYITEQTSPAIVEISTVENYKNLLNDRKQLSSIVFGYFTDPEHELLKALSEIAGERLSKLRFAYSVNPDVIKEAGFSDKIVVHIPAVIRSPSIEPDHEVYKGSAKVDEIKKFISSSKHGICGIRKKDNTHEFPGPVVVAYMSIDIEKDPGKLLYVRNRMIKAAKELLKKFDNLKFAISDSSDFYREISDAGLDFDRTKVSVVAYDNSSKKFKMEKKFGIDLLVDFVTNMMEGKIEPTMKSEQIPENPIDQGLHVVVAKNFDDVVMKSDKDVFIEFYAPWCGHCKNLAPVLTKLAEKMQENSDKLIIAKMNAADNEVFKPFEVQGFPTLYFVPKNDKTHPIKYTGGRKLEDFVEYLRTVSTEPLVGLDKTEEKIPEKEL